MACISEGERLLKTSPDSRSINVYLGIFGLLDRIDERTGLRSTANVADPDCWIQSRTHLQFSLAERPSAGGRVYSGGAPEQHKGRVRDKVSGRFVVWEMPIDHEGAL